MSTTLLIADDEPLLALALRQELAALWPQAEVVATVNDGPSALAAVREHEPDVAFLDIRMPGMSGIEVAKQLLTFDAPPLVVFVTAFDQFAVEAFEQSAVDYVLKPMQRERLTATVERLKQRLAQPTEAKAPDTVLSGLIERLQALGDGAGKPSYLRFIKALVGQDVRIIPVEDVIYLEATDKYVNVVSRSGEALIRASLRDLLAQLDPDRFWQIHRGTVVNIDCVASATHQSLGRLALRLRDRPETLPVARQYSHLFKQM
jgi:DNA-binding LytR/AlgR family response regulator